MGIKTAIGVITTTALCLVGYRKFKKNQIKNGKLFWFLNVPLIIAIDIGSSSVRCSAWGCPETDWTVLEGSSVQVEYNIFDENGHSDAKFILKNVDQVVNDCIAYLRTNGLLKNLKAIGFSSFCMNLVGVDNKGRAVTPVFTYADSSSSTTKYTAELQDILKSRHLIDTIQNKTGVPIHASYASVQLFRFSKEQKEIFNNVKTWQTLSSYILANWTGNTVLPISYSEASWTGLLDFRELEWEKTLLDCIDLNESTLPNLVSESECLTGVTKKYLSKWPELEEVKLFYGISDGVAANIGTNCTSNSRIAVTIGTSAAMRVALKLRVVLDERISAGLWCYRYSKDMVLLGGALTDGGSMYEWFHDIFSSDQETIKMAARLQPNEHGLVVLPFLKGERSTGWKSHASTAIVGISLATRPHHILRATMEAVALRLLAISIRLGEFTSKDSVLIASGKALYASACWRKIIADAVGKVLILEDSTGEATSKGVVLHLTKHLSVFECIQSPENTSSSMIKPSPSAYTVYLESLRQQETVYEKLL